MNLEDLKKSGAVVLDPDRRIAKLCYNKILEMIKGKGEVTIKEVAKFSGCPYHTAITRLLRLKKRGYLKVRREARRAYYSVKEVSE